MSLGPCIFYSGNTAMGRTHRADIDTNHSSPITALEQMTVRMPVSDPGEPGKSKAELRAEKAQRRAEAMQRFKKAGAWK